MRPCTRSVGTGPDHQREFTAYVTVGGDVIGTGTGSAKKHAEQEAAAQAYAAIVATDAARASRRARAYLKSSPFA